MFCNCLKPREWREALADIFSREKVDGKLRGELWELFEVKSFEEFLDEASDISWGIGRLVAGLVGKSYVRVLGDRLHYEKVMKRMNEYGCVRSKRFLVEGECPSKEVK